MFRSVFIIAFSLVSFTTLYAQPILPREKQAEIYMKNGDFLTAIALYDELLKEDPNNALYLLNRGWSKLNSSSFTLGADDLLAAAKLDAKCSRCFIGLAIMSMQNGYLDDALQQADMAVKAEDTASFNYFIRGQIYETKGDDFKAGLDFNKAIELNALQPDYYYSRGNYLFRLGKYEPAIDDFSNAILLGPQVADFHFQRGYTFYMQQKLDYALIDVRHAIELDSLQADYWLGKGAIEEAAGMYDEALSSYSRTAELNPKNALAYFNKAGIFYEKGLLDSSCTNYELSLYALSISRFARQDMQEEAQMMLRDHCDTASPSYYYQRGMMAIELKQHEKALEVLDQGIARWPAHPLLNAFKGNALLSLKRHREAIGAYADALKKTDETPMEVRNSYILASKNIDPDIYMRQLYSSVYDGLSKAYLNEGDLDSALINVDKAIFLAEKIPSAPIESLKLMRATVLMAQNREQEAGKLLDELIEANPELASAYVLRARLLLIKAIRQGNPKAKIRYATSAGSGMFYLERPKKYKEEKVDKVLVQNALSDCHTALYLSPNFSEAYFIQGQIKLFSGQQDYCNDFLTAQNLGITDAMTLMELPCQP